MLTVNPTTKLSTNSFLTSKCRYNNGNNENNDNIRAGVISEAGGGAETRFQLTVALIYLIVLNVSSLNIDVKKYL